MGGALARLAAAELQLEVGVALRDLDQGGDRRARQGRPAEVGVDDDTGGVDDAAEAGRRPVPQPSLDESQPVRLGHGGGGTFGLQLLAQCRDHQVVGKALPEPRVGRLVDEPSYGRQGSELVGYPVHAPRMSVAKGA